MFCLVIDVRFQEYVGKDLVMQSVITYTAHAYDCTNNRNIISTIYKTTHNLESTRGKFHLGPGLSAHFIKKE